jgi:DNA-binding MarR family transcriptional regulator
MSHTTSTISLEQSFIVLIEFLMLSKHRVIELGTEYGLTGMQTIMLFMLDRPRSMNNFKKVFNCDASNVTGLVDGLEQKDLASRYEASEDRRIKMVKLEPKGEDVRSSLVKKLSKRDSPLLDRLTSEEFDTLVGLLQKITVSNTSV